MYANVSRSQEQRGPFSLEMAKKKERHAWSKSRKFTTWESPPPCLLARPPHQAKHCPPTSHS